MGALESRSGDWGPDAGCPGRPVQAGRVPRLREDGSQASRAFPHSGFLALGCSPSLVLFLQLGPHFSAPPAQPVWPLCWYFHMKTHPGSQLCLTAKAWLALCSATIWSLLSLLQQPAPCVSMLLLGSWSKAGPSYPVKSTQRLWMGLPGQAAVSWVPDTCLGPPVKQSYLEGLSPCTPHLT